jgi:hypothetical protein
LFLLDLCVYIKNWCTAAPSLAAVSLCLIRLPTRARRYSTPSKTYTLYFSLSLFNFSPSAGAVIVSCLLWLYFINILKPLFLPHVDFFFLSFCFCFTAGRPRSVYRLQLLSASTARRMRIMYSWEK